MHRCLLLLSVWFCSAVGAAAQPAGTFVTYLHADVLAVRGDTLRLNDGSVWRVESLATPFLPHAQGIVVLPGEGSRGMFYTNGRSLDVRALGPLVAFENGTLLTIDRVLGGGAVLRTEGGVLWEVHPASRAATTHWPAPYQVLVSADGRTLYHLPSLTPIEAEQVR